MSKNAIRPIDDTKLTEEKLIKFRRGGELYGSRVTIRKLHPGRISRPDISICVDYRAIQPIDEQPIVNVEGTARIK
jgi:hypothetical protein